MTQLTRLVDARVGTAYTSVTAAFYCPFGYGECEDARGCVYPGRCPRSFLDVNRFPNCYQPSVESPQPVRASIMMKPGTPPPRMNTFYKASRTPTQLADDN